MAFQMIAQVILEFGKINLQQPELLFGLIGKQTIDSDKTRPFVLAWQG
jgi:hypothetical protein